MQKLCGSITLYGKIVAFILTPQKSMIINLLQISSNYTQIGVQQIPLIPI